LGELKTAFASEQIKLIETLVFLFLKGVEKGRLLVSDTQPFHPIVV
jgi:hypothetical protein